MNAKQKYIKKMREYWNKTRGSGISGTRALEPENFEKIIGDYYDSLRKGNEVK